MSSFPVAEEVRVDELVDDRLVRGIDFFELDAHADAPVAPRDAPFRVDVFLRARHPEPHFDFRAVLERARGADGDAAVAEAEGQRRRNGVAEPVLNGNAEHDPRAAPAV